MTDMSPRDRATHVLWEKHCAKQRGKMPWPPSEKEIQEEIDRADNAQGWDDSAPGS